MCIKTTSFTGQSRFLITPSLETMACREADVLIIGAGLSGLRAALEVDPQLRVVVITKDRLWESNSSYAQGGIAARIDATDRFEWHIQDTLNAGCDLCDPAVVEWVIKKAPQCIRELIAMKTEFDRDESHQRLVLGREGGHRHHRIIHARGDATGAVIMRAIIDQVRSQSNVKIIENAFTLDLITDDSRCGGAVVVIHGQPVFISSRQTILCTGGAGQLYQETTNPGIATADGHAMAFRAGVEMRNMEFMQFHPTVLYVEGNCRGLISEAVRGEGAYLTDVNGYRFMEDYDARRELAPRDIVSQAIVSQMEKTDASNVFLDLRHLNAGFVRRRFPGITRACSEFGLDITGDPIPVKQGAHYMIGGVTVDLEGRTSLPDLWAAGEVTCSGLHGANRLASNSLLEGLVFGASAGRGASAAAQTHHSAPPLHPGKNNRATPPTPQPPPSDLRERQAIRHSLKLLMGDAVGVRRHAASLKNAQKSVHEWQQRINTQEFSEPDGWELQNMLTVASLMISSASGREESRGVHWRTDFPKTDHRRRHHSSVCRDPFSMNAAAEAVTLNGR